MLKRSLLHAKRSNMQIWKSNYHFRLHYELTDLYKFWNCLKMKMWKGILSFNSCSSDNTVTIFENAKDSRSMFKFNSFRFQRLEKVSTVWLHCEVQVCDGERLICQPVSTTLLYTVVYLLLFNLSTCTVRNITEVMIYFMSGLWLLALNSNECEDIWAIMLIKTWERLKTLLRKLKMN